jgi:hypothetical protein
VVLCVCACVCVANCVTEVTLFRSSDFQILSSKNISTHTASRVAFRLHHDVTNGKYKLSCFGKLTRNWLNKNESKYNHFIFSRE